MAPNGHYPRGVSTFAVTLLYLDTIQTVGVSKHYIIGLIRLQRRHVYTVAVQLRCIPKCSVKASAALLKNAEAESSATLAWSK
jgi:hypothetical protein